MENPYEIMNKKLDKIESLLLDLNHQDQKEKDSEFLSEYIPKAEVRGKLASSSTLWKYEKQGRITAYAIGGKRFYKKEDLEALFVKLDKVGGLV